MIKSSIPFEKYPFLTHGSYANEDFVGIVQNSSKTIFSMYCLNDIKDERLVSLFLKYGNEWWRDSNRTVAIEIFLKPDFNIFKPYLKHFNAKEFNVQSGPIVSMSGVCKKKIKKKHCQLVRF